MNEIVKLYNDHRVRIIELNGEPWFIAKDVCEVLNLDIKSGARGLPNDEKGLHNMQTLGSEQKVQIINEPGVYRLVIRSRKKEAENFKRWVFHDVLPSIRKTGAYIAPNISLKQIAAVVKKLFNLAKNLIEKNAYLEQFSPKGELGDISSVNGKPKWLQRRGCYVSGHGSRPKRLNPDKGGYLQLDLFRDFIPLKVMEEAMSNIINNTQQLQENNQ